MFFACAATLIDSRAAVTTDPSSTRLASRRSPPVRNSDTLSRSSISRTWTSALRSMALVACGIFAGLLAVARPEGIPLGLLVASVFVREKRVDRAVRVAVPWGVAVAAYVGSNLLKTGHAMPPTLSGRRWMWLGETAGLTRGQEIGVFVERWLFFAQARHAVMNYYGG